MWSQCGVKLDEKGRKRGENGKEVSMWGQCGVNLESKWITWGGKVEKVVMGRGRG